MMLRVLPGQSFPLGATVTPLGVNFCVFSKSAELIELLLFDAPDADHPTHVIPLNSDKNRSFHYWHVFVVGVKAGQIYGYRSHGLYDPSQGYRFDPSKVLLDPYSKAIVNDDNYDRNLASLPGYDNCAQALKGVVVDTSAYDWEGDRLLHTPYKRSVIYEMHVAGFTRHPNSGLPPEKRGTYRGLIEKIPYLKSLGITAVELLPVHFFDAQDARPSLSNYWGYSTIGFFAPHRAYSSCTDALSPINEFRDMVKALHQAGIEVILDVVFNHTAEADEHGPTLSFRGLENEAYYILEPEDRRLYRNYSGCGNSMRANHPIVSQMILDSLRYWVSEMHVDGFRFDLASVLSRDDMGLPVERSPILWTIEMDPVLARTKIIAEAWDAAGLYQVGQFVGTGDRFAEWNGPFRDDMRRFIKGDRQSVKQAAARLMGSPDIYHLEFDTNRSINFVTCHDGFTLNDVVSYNEKHNEANGEDNRDGANDNHSWNCGIEGPTNDPYIEALRDRQTKNLLCSLFFAQGTPMMLMGDEVRRSQQGNNNGYCQDNEIGWFDWEDVEHYAENLRFSRHLIAFIQSLQLFQLDRVLTNYTEPKAPKVVWHGVRLGEPDWGDDSHSLAVSLLYPAVHEHLHLMFNAYWEPLTFELPPLDYGDRWHRILDTARPSPDDICPKETAPKVMAQKMTLTPRSVVVLMAL